MSKKKYAKQKTRAEPKGEKSAYICNLDSFDDLCCSGYTKLSHNPEIMAAVNKIANLVGSMTIHLMENTDKGDKRVHNELSKKLDINPNYYMTRLTFVSFIVRTLLLEGDGNVVIYPETKRGLIENLHPLRASDCTFIPDGFGYKISINGTLYAPDNLVHIAMNPDPYYPWKGTGIRTQLKPIAETLKQATVTKKGFMESKWKPSIIVKADGITEEFSSKEGRTKLLNKYIETSEAGQPWIIPAEQFQVETVRPLSLNDLAIKDNIELDKKTIASILDIPSFVLGIGTFNEVEWNNFINTRIRTIAMAIEQGLTKGLLISPRMYLRMNSRSLLAYDIEKLANVGANLYTRGIMDGNEVRDWIGKGPREGLDELIILENYIPQGMIGDQKKLNKGGES